MKYATLVFDLFDGLDRGMGGAQDKQSLFALHPDPGNFTGMITGLLRFFERGIFFVLHPYQAQVSNWKENGGTGTDDHPNGILAHLLPDASPHVGWQAAVIADDRAFRSASQ
jgi:hypothetical protein